MCPPAATSVSFGKLGPIVPSRAWRVVSACKLPVAAIGRAHLVVVDGASSLDRGCRSWFREGTGQRARWWRGRFRGKGVFSSFRRLAGKGALAAVVSSVVVGHVGVINGAAVPIVVVPLRQDAIGVMTVDVRSRAPTTPMAHTQAVETKPLHCRICTHHVAWTTPSDDNCRQAVDGT
jgi:hypothetical protein